LIRVDGFHLAGQVENEKGTAHSYVTNDALTCALLFACGEKANTEIRMGLAKAIQQGDCGKYDFGWYNCNNEYYGNGFEGFVNPFIWNKQTKGIQIKYAAKKLECFAHYGTSMADAAEVSSADSFGFGNSNTPSICNLGACYSVEGACPVKLGLVCTQINNGSKGFSQVNWLNRNDDDEAGSGSMTAKASAALSQAQEKDQYLPSLTGTCESDYKGFGLNAALTCANPKNTSDNTARIMKWSVGCVSKCKKLKCIADYGIQSQAFGLNIGTPAYLSEDLVSTQANSQSGASGIQTLKADATPIVCEANCLINFCGFNVPIFFDYMNNHGGLLTNSDGIYSLENATGSAIICGMRPNRLTQINCGKDGTTWLQSNMTLSSQVVPSLPQLIWVNLFGLIPHMIALPVAFSRL
jgi:hypothetical protein